MSAVKKANPVRLVETDLTEHVRQENAAYREIVRRTMEREVSEASGHRGLWTEPKYPGGDVRYLGLYHHGRRECGMISIQHCGRTVRVGSFLPGTCYNLPGDTPKTVPEKSEYFRADNQTDLADAEFDKYVQEAYADGWQNTPGS
jgi:hypothetical protein